MSQWSGRTQFGLWVAAVALSVLPAVIGMAASLLGVNSQGYGAGFVFSANGTCSGWLNQADVYGFPGYRYVGAKPYLVTVPAFLVWLVTRRRAVGWAAVAILVPVALADPALLGYDLARWGSACVDLWQPLLPGRRIAWWTWRLVLVALLIAAVYRPGARMVRTVSGTLVLGLMLGVAGDQRPPRVVMESPDDCGEVRPVLSGNSRTLVAEMKRLSEEERQLAYLCSVRGYPERMLVRRYPAPKDPLSDAVLLDRGRRACRGEWPSSLPLEVRRRGAQWPSLQQMAYLCPRTAALRLGEQERRRAELKAQYERNQARGRAYCERTVPQGPEPVREATDVASGGEGSSYFVGRGGGAVPTDDLVEATGGSATVITGTEGDFCLTVRAYRTRPPLALEGWERVAEVGIHSPDGRLAVGSAWGPLELPDLAVSVPGPYRLRVHVRGRGEPETFSPQPPAERHLLVVFPGRSKERQDFKDEER